MRVSLCVCVCLADMATTQNIHTHTHTCLLRRYYNSTRTCACEVDSATTHDANVRHKIHTPGYTGVGASHYLRRGMEGMSHYGMGWWGHVRITYGGAWKWCGHVGLPWPGHRAVGGMSN